MVAYVFDACSIIAHFQKEPGHEKVKRLLLMAAAGECIIHMHLINVLEIYYNLYRDESPEVAQRVYEDIMSLPIEFSTSIENDIFNIAGHIKATYRLSLADAIVAAVAKTRNAQLVTSDHHEFDVLDKNHEVGIYWIR